MSLIAAATGQGSACSDTVKCPDGLICSKESSTCVTCDSDNPCTDKTKECVDGQCQDPKKPVPWYKNWVVWILIFLSLLFVIVIILLLRRPSSVQYVPLPSYGGSMYRSASQ